ncbi:unnamed protein product, partial [Didymodactylos carnosus]
VWNDPDLWLSQVKHAGTILRHNFFPLEDKRIKMDNKNSNNKRGADDPNQDNNNNKRSRSAKVDLRFLVASRDAGAIIGRGGKNIQQLRTKHKTIIQVPDCDGPERILTIGGEIDACIDCLTDVLPTMADNQRLRQDQNELRALIHQSQAG